MREYFEQQLPPDVDGITVVFFEELADGTLAKGRTVHPAYTDISGMVFVQWVTLDGIDHPVFKRVA